MQWTGKLIGGALGMALGPVGAVLGVAVGHQYDLQNARRTRPATEQFFVSTFRLMGHVAKADGRVSEREIDAARGVMRALNLDAAQVRFAIEEFTRGKDDGLDIAAEMQALRTACGAQPGILRTFLEIQLRFALAGSDLAGNARRRLGHAAQLLGFDAPALARIEAALRGGGSTSGSDHAARTAAAYQALESEPSATNEQLTRNYRRLMSRHHPDKLKANGLPDSMLEHAKQRTQQIREAYELLRTQRGIG